MFFRFNNSLKRLLEFLTGDLSGVFILLVRSNSIFPDIGEGDVVIVSSNQKPSHGQKIVALVGGKYTLKRFEHSGSGLRLVASNGEFALRQITEKDDFEIVGVVSHVIKKFELNVSQVIHNSIDTEKL